MKSIIFSIIYSIFISNSFACPKAKRDSIFLKSDQKVYQSFSIKTDSLAKKVFDNIRDSTISRANKLLFIKPVTIVKYRCKRSSGGLHDFYSEGDYWWQNPEDPNGKYIRKDGQSNPDNFSKHREALIEFSNQVSTLTSAYLLSGNVKYAYKAKEHLVAWFVDSVSRMNPNFLYAQAVKGIHTGRGIGIIDAYHLVEVSRSAKLLIDNHIISKKLSLKIKKWFNSFLYWMTTHKYGIDEMNAKNNHGTSWVAIASSFAILVNNQKVIKFCVDRFKSILLPNQMDADGSFPLELSRTKPYGYSLFNIDAMCNVAQILSGSGYNLWQFETVDGKSIKKGLEFIYPYILNKSKWPFSKDIYIWEEWPVRQSSLLFSGIAYNKSNYIDTFLSLTDNPSNSEVIRNLPLRHPVIWLLSSPLKKTNNIKP